MSELYEDNPDMVPFEIHGYPGFDLSLPSQHNLTAESMMKWMEQQQAMVPYPYREDPDVWQIYDLEGYQQMVAGYITIRAEREKNGESIYPKDRPFITREIKESLR